MESSLNYYKNNISKVNGKLEELEKKLIVFSIIRFYSCYYWININVLLL